MSKIGNFYGSLPGKTLAKNYLINGNFDIWQRGTSQTLNAYGSDDRWRNDSIGTTKVHSRQSFTLGQTDVPGNPKYYSRTVVTSVAGASNYCHKFQNVEFVYSLSGRQATVSFWAKADTVKNIGVRLYQYFGAGGSPSTFVECPWAKLIALTTVWKKYTATFSVPSIAGKTLGTDNGDALVLSFGFDANPSLGAAYAGLGHQSGTFDIAQVQLEEGSVATEFAQRTVSEELALCQRYFQKSGILYGYAASSAWIFVHYSAIREFRTYPVATLTTTSPTGESPPWITSVNSTASILDGTHIPYSTTKFDITVGGFTGLIPGYPASLFSPIYFDAEL